MQLPKAVKLTWKKDVVLPNEIFFFFSDVVDSAQNHHFGEFNLWKLWQTFWYMWSSLRFIVKVQHNTTTL